MPASESTMPNRQSALVSGCVDVSRLRLPPALEELAPPKLEGDPLSPENLRIRDMMAYGIMAERQRTSQIEAERDAALRLAQGLDEQLNAVKNSPTWRVLARVRRITNAVVPVQVRRGLRRMLQVGWWVARGRLTTQLRAAHNAAVAERERRAAEELHAEPPQAARRPEDDYCLGVPLPRQLLEHSQARRVAAVVHMFYEDLASEFFHYLLNVPGSLDLFISARDEHGASLIREAFANWPKGAMEVRVAPNRGRDIAPKLITFADVYSRYEYVLHLHSKRSHHASVLSLWRQYLLETLVGTEDVVRSVYTLFESQPRLGMVAAQHYEPLRHWLNWGRGNLPQAKLLAHRMGFEIDDSKPLDCPTGSMFWARTAALKPLLDLQLRLEEFPEEGGQTDGTLAHAIERLYFYVCEHAGFDWLKVGRPEYLTHTPNIQEVREASRSALEEAVRRCTFRLRQPGSIEVRSAPLAPIERIPHLLERKVRAHALGLDRPLPRRPYRLAVGLLTFNNSAQQLTRAAGAVGVALQRLAGWGDGALYLLDNGTDSSNILPFAKDQIRLPSVGNVGFGAGHNRLMQAAFDRGADIYIAVNPDGALHPNALLHMVRMVDANDGLALVEACQFPAEHPKPYSSLTFETPWVSGACLAVPAAVFRRIGGFDESFFMYCEDVDLSWRAAARGVALRTCAPALFLHAVTNRDMNDTTRAMIYESGFRLAHKWHNPQFKVWVADQLEAVRACIPVGLPTTVPPEWSRHADFTQHFVFAQPRW